MLTATYRPPAEYQSPSSSRPQTRSKRPTDVRHSDLDLSEVEGGRGYTPAPPPPGNRLVTVKCFRMTWSVEGLKYICKCLRMQSMENLSWGNFYAVLDLKLYDVEWMSCLENLAFHKCFPYVKRIMECMYSQSKHCLSNFCIFVCYPGEHVRNIPLQTRIPDSHIPIADLYTTLPLITNSSIHPWLYLHLLIDSTDQETEIVLTCRQISGLRGGAESRNTRKGEAR